MEWEEGRGEGKIEGKEEDRGLWELRMGDGRYQGKGKGFIISNQIGLD